MSGHHLATVRRAGRKRGARFESSEALAEQSAVARSAVEMHGCCARVSRAAALVQQHPEHVDGVARASSAGTDSGSRARSLVLLTILAPVSRMRTVEGPASRFISNGPATLDRLGEPWEAPIFLPFVRTTKVGRRPIADLG